MKRMTRHRPFSDLDLQAEREGAALVVAGPDELAGLAAFMAGEQAVFSAERIG
jgi:hypothetical protein